MVQLKKPRRLLCLDFVTFLGTSEKIFQSKTSLYDVYVDGNTIKEQRRPLKGNSADKRRYAALRNSRFAIRVVRVPNKYGHCPIFHV